MIDINSTKAHPNNSGITITQPSLVKHRFMYYIKKFIVLNGFFKKYLKKNVLLLSCAFKDRRVKRDEEVGRREITTCSIGIEPAVAARHIAYTRVSACGLRHRVSYIVRQPCLLRIVRYVAVV